jgi:hypothetical protein
VLVLLALLPWAPAATAAEEPDGTPLTVRLTQLSPAAIPAKGQLTLSGTVTNDSEEDWVAVNVHPFVSTVPMTTREELAAAAETDPEADVGARLTDTGQFAAIGDLAPGESTSFQISLPVAVLPKAQGVYWIGVHALGQNTQGRDTVADGRARTFIPLVAKGTPSTSVALVVPVREAVRRDRSGRLLNPSGWSDSLAADGRLGRIAGFISSAGPHPLTMLVDPAVLDAVGDVAADNPPISFGTGTEATPSESPSPSPSRSGVRLEAGDRANAAAWMDLITTAGRRHSVLGLGYADPDVAALIRQRSPLRALANRLADETFTGLGIDAIRTVAPPAGWIDDDAVAKLAASSTVLVSDHSEPGNRTLLRAPGEQDLVVTDQLAARGGPGPTPALDALALRQRIVADAALRLTEHSPDPLVVQLPASWDPGAGWQQADFFDALDLPWLDQVALSPSTMAGAPTTDVDLDYPAAQRRLELPVENVTAARKLTQTTTALAQLLRSENDVAHDLAGVALNAVSVHARKDDIVARLQVIATTDRMRARMGKVEVLGTSFVTLSGGSGTLAVTLVNGLDQPILVGVRPQTSTGDVTVATTKPVKMAPGERTVLRLKAKASTIGVTQVTLTPVTAEGTELGTPLVFSLRTSQVGKTIWFVLIGFGALLVVMILRRVRRGLVEHRWKGKDGG